MIETSILAVARTSGLELELHLSNQEAICGRVIDYNDNMIVFENPHRERYDFIYLNEVVRYSIKSKEFYEQIMQYRKELFEAELAHSEASGVSGDDASAYLPKNLPEIPDCPEDSESR